MKYVDDIEIRHYRLIAGKTVEVTSRWLVIATELAESSFL